MPTYLLSVVVVIIIIIQVDNYYTDIQSRKKKVKQRRGWNLNTNIYLPYLSASIFIKLSGKHMPLNFFGLLSATHFHLIIIISF